MRSGQRFARFDPGPGFLSRPSEVMLELSGGISVSIDQDDGRDATPQIAWQSSKAAFRFLPAKIICHFAILLAHFRLKHCQTDVRLHPAMMRLHSASSQVPKVTTFVESGASPSQTLIWRWFRSACASRVRSSARIEQSKNVPKYFFGTPVRAPAGFDFAKTIKNSEGLRGFWKNAENPFMCFQ